MISTPISEMSNLWNFGVNLYKDFINRNGFLYACDFEARLNLDIIDAINTNTLKGEVNAEAFAELVNSFETKAMLAMIAGIDRRNNHKLVKLFKEKIKFVYPLEEEGDTAGKETIDDLIGNFSFAVRKIESLRRIYSIALKDKTLIKDLYLDKRINNIKKALLGIRNCLKEVIIKIE